ncbi:MAG: peptide chain release factor-like protein [Deltaproteobacteria bacterium]|nr:peptide chain release factor-like protein [Deltaproteobacteria bacterium]
MIDFGVTERKKAEIEQRMQKCNLFEKDIEEKFVRSSGAGGQKVNKSSTCVHLKHIPSGLAVKVQKSRSQGLNRYYARKRMCELLENKLLGKESPEAKRIEKIRKQKDRRRRKITQKKGQGKRKLG